MTTYPRAWVYGTSGHVPFRGDFCGIPFQASMGPPLIYTPMYPCFGDDERRAMRELYAMRYPGGMWPINICGTYNDRGRPVYPLFDYSTRPEDYRHFLLELRSQGLHPLVFLLAEENHHKDAEHLAHFIAVNHDLLDQCVVGWEVNDWLSPAEVTTACRKFRTMLGPDPYLWMHMTGQHGACCEGDGCEPRWWESLVGVLSGNLYQEFPPTPNDTYQQNLADWVLRLKKGYWNIHPPMHVVAFERYAFYKFRGQKTEQDGIEQGKIAMQVDGLDGFGDGGPA
jgi:hypothetical protein